MKIYLVRHGETSNNAKLIHQDGLAKLSNAGLKQAEGLAKRFTEIKIDAIITSPLERAKKTAEIIAETKNLDVEVSDLFVERKRPSEIENKPMQSPRVLEIKEKLWSNYEDTVWHYSDEENAEDIKRRALKAIKLLEQRSEDDILVVTHGTIMRAIIAVMLYGDDLTPHESVRMQQFLSNTNTGITLVEHKKRKWKLLTWNDYSHLG